MNHYRGKRVDNNQWVYGFYRKNSFYDKFSDEPKLMYTKHFIGAFDNLQLFDDIFEQVEVTPESVGQYTGMEIDGVKLYAGMKLTLKGKFYWIEYDNKTASFVGKNDALTLPLHLLVSKMKREDKLKNIE